VYNRRVGIEVTILGSGSAGNCTLIETERTALLVDAGLSGRQITHRLASINRTVADLDAILLTHEHSDHTRALNVLCRTLPIPVYANRLTAEAINTDPELSGPTKISWRLFSTGSPFEVGDCTVESFSVPHDASDPVGFAIRSGPHAVGVLTDLGHATKLVIERMRTMDVLVLESNHDVKLLQEDTARPWALKQRIMSRHGHLSNDDAATLAGEVCSDRLRHVLLAHLSRDCNRPEIAHRVVAQKLPARVRVAVSTQDQPTATVSL
jgi:phosphoribosyl 1,2-cyclic phosphodiesterase